MLTVNRNMFLAASPYFQRRFRNSPWILTHFASAIISVSTVTNLLVMLVLAQLQRHASYPSRITASLLLNICAFTLLALSTVFFRSVSPGGYFAFLMVVVLMASVACALCQNGAFAYVAGFGKSEYTQGIMAGQAVAGVLPCVAQIVSVLSVPEVDSRAAVGQESPKSAFAYFLTATAVSMLTLAAFSVLVKRHGENKAAGADEAERIEGPGRKVVGLWTLFRKLHWLALAVALTYAATMFFPIFTQQILSVRPAAHAPRLLRPACFIPLAFLFWNSGDLVGRLLTLVPGLSRAPNYPAFVFILALLRLGFIPLYLLCNIRGRGAVVASDAFYLLVVQLLFGVSSGYIGSTCMMGAARWVEVEEREAAGGFMGLMLCAGLTVGSLLSFLAA